MQGLSLFGATAPNTHVAERIGEMTIRGDDASVASWKVIAERLDAVSGVMETRQ